MPAISIVCLVQKDFDGAKALFERAFEKLKVDVEIINEPYFLLSALRLKRLQSLKSLLKNRSINHFVVFFPNSTELFLEEADFLVLFSAYRSWFNEEKMKVIPHLWTPVDSLRNTDELTWTAKPPLRIGFMGRSHATSKLANITITFPIWIKEWLLRGSYLQHTTLIALLGELGISLQNIDTFPRIEAIRILREKKRDYVAADLDLVEKQHFGGKEQELIEYKQHLKRNTYVICARGSENYSYRLYETLTFGRVPVIVDTDMVLPKEINWDRLCIIVPYRSLDRIYEAILRDYESQSAAEFAARQQEAFSIMAELRKMRWAKDLATQLASLGSKKEMGYKT
jgi:hypothetical protein